MFFDIKSFDEKIHNTTMSLKRQEMNDSQLLNGVKPILWNTGDLSKTK